MISFSCLLYLHMIFLENFSHGFQNSFKFCIKHFKPIESSPYQLDVVYSLEHLVFKILLSLVRSL